ncbi:HalOD1 output domain-containing protein [Halobacterium rubrum]|uniref:HalOD1 output domain-containing protein n=1 Tax=Halobacterium TaxID=2239 RepID=UPI001F468708|nr:MULTISPECIES: HalOD1 output domain-containing protein [Halobacterium]MDH5019516.1 hypothetical protein [Halobacterium rubrum]
MDPPDISVDDDGTVRYAIDPHPDTAEFDLLAGIAEVEGVDMDELPSLYTAVNRFVEELFGEPPSATAHVELSFSYAGYRVNVDQNGHIRLVPVKESLPEEE